MVRTRHGSGPDGLPGWVSEAMTMKAELIRRLEQRFGLPEALVKVSSWNRVAPGLGVVVQIDQPSDQGRIRLAALSIRRFPFPASLSSR